MVSFSHPCSRNMKKMSYLWLKGISFVLIWGSVQRRTPHPKNHWTHYVVLGYELIANMKRCIGVSVHERKFENFQIRIMCYQNGAKAFLFFSEICHSQFQRISDDVVEFQVVSFPILWFIFFFKDIWVNLIIFHQTLICLNSQGGFPCTKALPFWIHVDIRFKAIEFHMISNDFT